VTEHRTQRVVPAALALALACLLAWPAAAHDSTVLVRVSVQAPVAGQPVRLRAVTTYPDGHRAGGLEVEAVAVRGAERVEVRLSAEPRRGDWVGTARLGPGRWRVQATAAGDAKGSGSATATVPAPAATAGSTTTQASPPAATTTPGGPAGTPLGPGAGGGAGTPVLVALAAAALAAALVAARGLTRRGGRR
jgi:hypothetical protein